MSDLSTLPKGQVLQLPEVSPTNNQTATFGDQNVAVGYIGNHNSITMGNGNDTLALYGEGNSGVLGNGNNTVGLEGVHSHVTLGNGNNTVALGRFEQQNTIALGSGTNSIVSIGKGSDTFILAAGRTAMIMSGKNNQVFMNGGAAAVAHAGDTEFHIGALGAVASIANFAGVIDLVPSLGFDSAAAAASAVRPDGHGGSMLLLHGHGVIAFAGISPDHLHTSNFRIA